MGLIAIRLNPGKLSNPDADVRYAVPDVIANATGERVRDDGFDYTKDGLLIIYLACHAPASDVRDVIATLGNHDVCGNNILDTAVIGISTDARIFSVVHPANQGGEFTVSPW